VALGVWLMVKGFEDRYPRVEEPEAELVGA
jgi:hypothetical protein